MVNKLVLSTLSLAELKQYVNVEQKGIRNYVWTHVEAVALTPEEEHRVQSLQKLLATDPVHLLNEATIWARVIYPLIQLAEAEDIRALAGVPLQAHYPKFELEGIADGVIGKSYVGKIESPYLVMVETKRGIEGQNPIFQLYGQLLAAARLNWEDNHQEGQEVFGCYTIADSWTFVRAEVSHIDSDQPSLRAELSKEYSEKVDAATILKLLKAIVAKYIDR